MVFIDTIWRSGVQRNHGNPLLYNASDYAGLQQAQPQGSYFDPYSFSSAGIRLRKAARLASIDSASASSVLGSQLRYCNRVIGSLQSTAAPLLAAGSECPIILTTYVALIDSDGGLRRCRRRRDLEYSRRFTYFYTRLLWARPPRGQCVREKSTNAGFSDN